MASFLDSLIPSAGVNTSTDLYNTGMGQQALSDISGLSQYNLGGQNMGQFSGLTQQGIANPFAGGYQAGAGTAGAMGQQAGLGQFGAGQNMMNFGQSFQPDVQSLINMGFDPQQALYSRTAQQLQQQQQAANSQSGLGGTPYGAGVTGQTMANFNIDWQNQQLARAAQGAGAAGNLATTGAGIQGAGAALQNQGVNQYLQGSAMPYMTADQINQMQLGKLSGAEQYGIGAAQIPQMQTQDQMAYLQQAQTAQQAMTNAQLQQARDEAAQGQQIAGDIAGLATGGMSFMGGMGAGMGGMGGGGGMPSFMQGGAMGAPNMNMGFPGMGGGTCAYGMGSGGYGNYGNYGNPFYGAGQAVGRGLAGMGSYFGR